jgi:hypothetical protein
MTTKPLLIFTGESNSGGYALNSELPTQSARPAVQILNNSTLLFEDLCVGVNNLIGHAGLLNGVTHGWENGLALAAEAGDWSGAVHLVKTGQGGSVISQWDKAGAFFTTMQERVSAAKALIRAGGDVPLPFIGYSQGINDSIAATDVATWKAATISHFKKPARSGWLLRSNRHADLPRDAHGL